MRAHAIATGVLVLQLTTLASAQSQRVLLMPTRGDGAPAERAAVEQALAVALKLQRIEVVHGGEPAAGKTETPPCQNAECAALLRQAAGADLALLSALWSGPQAGAAHGTVSVLLVDAAGERYPADAQAEGDTADAAERALLAAQGLRLLGPGPWLEVTAEAQNATLYIDGHSVGALPYRGAISGGPHQLRIEAEGRATWQQQVDIPLRALRVVRVQPELRPAVPERDTLPTRDRPTRDRPSVLNYVAGGALAVTGAVLLIAPLRTLAEDGECDDRLDDRGRCSARVDASTGTFVQLGAGSALLLGGGAVLLLQPFRVELAASPQHAYVRISTDLP